MQYHTIITHEYPDLDAILCCYLLKKYGERRYEGIKNAKIAYFPAGKLPQQKTPDALEKEGFLPVDIGGGRLDTHPSENKITEEKKSLSASNLVAKDLGVDGEKSLEKILEFAKQQDSTGKSLSSRNPIDHVMALPNLIKGALFYFGENFADITTFFFKVLEAIEHASSVERNDFFDNQDYLLAVDNETIYTSGKPTLKSLFGCYLLERYLPKKYKFLFGDSPENATKWYSVGDLLIHCKVENNQELEKVVSFVTSIKPQDFLLNSKEPLDEEVSFTNIVRGFYKYCDYKIENCIQDIFLLFDFLIAHEKNWYTAIKEYNDKKKIFLIGKIKVVAISATTGAVVKVARWKDRADLTIFHDENKHHLSLSLNRAGRLSKWMLGRLAARLRIAETYFSENSNVDIDSDKELTVIGELIGWFLHQSEKLLIHGSPKAHRPPSKIPFSIIVELAVTEIDRYKKLPDVFCPEDRCLHGECIFYSLRLPNCFEHRQNNRKIQDT